MDRNNNKTLMLQVADSANAPLLQPITHLQIDTATKHDVISTMEWFTHTLTLTASDS